MTVLREVTINGVIWLACIANGQTHVLDRVGKVGDCRRPGTRTA